MKQELTDVMQRNADTSMNSSVDDVSGVNGGIEINGSGDATDARNGYVNHKQKLLEEIGSKLSSSEFSDFALMVDREKIPAHKFILGARSSYFQKLVVSNKELTIDYAGINALKAALKYLYTGELLLSKYELNTIIEILELAQHFELPEFVSCIANYLKHSITIKNVWMIYNCALNLNIETLQNQCLHYMDINASAILIEDTTLSQKTVDNLRMLLKRPTFLSPEVDKFKAVYNWINKNPRAEQEDILSYISLEQFAQEELLETVRPTQLIPDSKILDAIGGKRKRSRLSIDSGTNTEMFKFDTNAYAFAPKMTIKTVKHETEAGCFYYLAEFEEPFEINHINMRLSELIGNKGEFCYYIEISNNGTDWTKVIDYSNIVCRSWQNLYFDLTLVKEIKVVGTKADGAISDIIIDHFEAKRLVTNIPEYSDGFVVPNDDISNLNCGTRIKYPVNRHDLYLLQSTQSFACFIPVRSFGSDLKKNAFNIQFSQPYLIDSMEFKIYYKEKDNYKYYVQVSTDEVHWDIIDDKRETGSRGHHKLTFDRRPVTFVRIVGTEGYGPGASKFLGCSSFKCPAE